MIAEYRCAVCGEINETIVDESAGMAQQYTEDCRVCCRPNLLSIVIEEEGAQVLAEFDE